MSSSTVTTYQYEALVSLRSFRLLKVKPGNVNDPLEGELQDYELPRFIDCKGGQGLNAFFPRSVVPDFQALSYVWGALEPGHDFRCNGKIIRITGSLQHALRLVRSQDHDIFVWADAICINQDDMIERREQVDLMRDIYSKAKLVSICLNLDETLSNENQRFLGRLMEGRDVWTYNHQLRRGLLRRDGSVASPAYVKDICLNPPQRYWPIIAAFFDNPWFSRIWVVQEVVQSESCRVLLGGREIPWRNIVYVAHQLVNNQELRDCVGGLMRTNGIRNVLFMSEETPLCVADPIPALLQQTRDFGASDPRDKVYAVLHKPLPPTLTHVVRHFLDPRKYVEFLAQAISLLYLTLNTFQHSLTNSSFWSSLFSLGCVAYLLGFLKLGGVIICDLGRRLTDFLAIADRILLHNLKDTGTIRNTLYLTADYSLPVQTIYRTVATRAIERSRSLDILSYIHHGTSYGSTYPSWVPRWDVATNGMNVIVETRRFQASANMKHSFRPSPQGDDHLVVEGVRFSTVSSMFNVTEWANDGKQKTDNRSLALRKPNMYKYRDRVALTILAELAHGRQRFVTENGALGFGPPAMKIGDIVYVLFGGRVPYVLRATDTDSMYRIIGECYVDGMMSGQVIDMWKNGDLAKSFFTLC